MEIVLLFFVALTFFVYCCRNWKSAVFIALFLAVVEGALRKWFLPQASILVFFLKDFTLLGAYTGYYIGPFLKRKPTYTVPILSDSIFFITLCFGAMIFNPALGSPIVGIIGAKLYIFYIPLMFMTRDLFKDTLELRRFLQIFTLCMIPIAILAIIQFFSPSSSPLNVYLGGKEADATVGQFVRVTGTFSYIAGYVTYLTVCLAFVLPLIFTEPKFIWNLINLCTASLIAITGFMTGSRTSLIAIGFMFTGFTFMQLDFSKGAKKYFVRFLIPSIFITIFVARYFNDAVNAFIYRAQTSGGLSSRITGSFTEIFDFARVSDLFGFGPGSTYQATPILRSMLNLPIGDQIPVGYEGELGRVILEIGPFGFLLWYGLRVYLLWLLWRSIKSLSNPLLRSLGQTTFLLQIISLPAQIVFIHTSALYYWFLNGFIFLLPNLQNLEKPTSLPSTINTKSL
uniref:O-antigen polymerase n=1 Tax=Cyanothece sp. (strain PCC 7425 / ATCC 29141) TaxID=395961 RepID=B8HNC8_CYAP4